MAPASVRRRAAAAEPLPPPQHSVPDPAAEQPLTIKIDLIDPNPWNPRRFPKRPDPEDKELTTSIAQHGVRMPLIVRPGAEGRYQLVAGERRLRSARAALLKEVPAIVRALDDREARVETAIENLHRKQLHFLEEAQGVAELFDENWTIEMVAAKLNKPRSWVARRRRLLNLTPQWRELAEGAGGFTEHWSAEHFEQIAVLEATAQEELLTVDRYQLERCGTLRDLRRLIGSRTRALSSFPWPLEDADLDPVAGACSVCPHRSSRHPSLFDDQEAAAEPASKTRKRSRVAAGESPDRCLNPLCAARKGVLLVERTKAKLAAKHPVVLALHDGYPHPPIPGAFYEHQLAPAKKGSAGAVPAVFHNGPRLAEVKWVKPTRQELARLVSDDKDDKQDAPDRHKSFAERQEQKWRQRKVHAIELLKGALELQPPPPLLTSVRLAIVFGTAHTNASSASSFDLALRKLVSGTDLPAAATAAAPAPSDSAAAGVADAGDPLKQEKPKGLFWGAFDDLAFKEAVYGEHLWARTLPVMLGRMTPNGDWRHVDIAWHEAERVAELAGLRAQEYLDQARVALPNPKSWAKEEARSMPPTLAGVAGTDGDPSPQAAAETVPAGSPKPLRPRRPASRLPR